MASLMGEVDLLGLDIFGKSAGHDALAGVLIGGGTSAIVERVANRSGKDGNLWGMLAGAATAAVLYHKVGKGAAMGAVAGAIFSSGLDWALSKIFGSSGTGLPMIQSLNGLGLPTIEYYDAPPLNGLGLPGIGPVPECYGAVPGTCYGAAQTAAAAHGVAGPQLGQAPPVDLLGEQTAQSNQLQLMGGPAVSGLSGMYGANLFGFGQ